MEHLSVRAQVRAELQQNISKLLTAAKNGQTDDLETIKKLVRKVGVDAKDAKFGRTALHWGVEVKQNLCFLLSRRYHELNSVLYKWQEGHTDVVELLLELNADVNFKGESRP